MGTLLSLSKSATVVWQYVALGAVVVFGSLFLLSWIAEEFSEKWKAYRKTLIIAAIVGCLGEQLFTIAEFALSEHLQTIDEGALQTVNSHSRGLFAPDETKKLFNCLARATPKGVVFVIAKAFDDRSSALAGQLRAIMGFAGYNAKPQPPNTNAILSLGTVGTVIFTRDGTHPPPQFKPIIDAFGCADMILPIGNFTSTIGWLNPGDVLIVVSSEP